MMHTKPILKPKLFLKNNAIEQKKALEESRDKNSCLEILKLPMIVAQCCGLFPVCGITKSTADQLYFKWFTLRTVFSIFCITGNICMAVFFFYWISIRGLRLENLGSLVFYSTSLICTVLFLRLARRWPQLAKEWENVEGRFVQYPSVKNSPSKYKQILIIILFVAFIEHTLAVAISFGWISKCTNENLGILHIQADFPQWFCFIDYNHFKAILVEYFNWISTFNWNYNDIFIILLSEILTEKYRQINAKIKFGQVNVINQQFYETIREDYTSVSKLCASINDAISNIVTLSFVSNIMHICIQLYNILRPRETLVEYFYFFFSLGFLIARAVLVSLFASSINDESKIPIILLNSVPALLFNVDVGGTVLAYELVLLQLPRPVSKADLYLQNATDEQKIAFICNVSRLCEP